MLASMMLGHFQIVHAEEEQTVVNQALSAAVTSNNELEQTTLGLLKDGIKSDSENGIYVQAALDTALTDYYQFNWENAISVNLVNLVTTKARHQGPSAWHIEVSEDGSTNWKEVASVTNVTWKELGAVAETKELSFDIQKDIKGLRIYIDKSSVDVSTDRWGGYWISELEVYNTIPSDGNYAATAVVSSNKGLSNANLLMLNDGINEENTNGFWVNAPLDTTLNDYYQFDWDYPITVGQVNLSTTKARHQGPSAWRIEVTKDGNIWTKVASVSDVTWKELGGVVEKYTLLFGIQKDIKGLRVYIEKTSVDTGTDRWAGYWLCELEIYERKGYVTDWKDDFDESTLNSDKWLPEYLPHNTSSAEGCQTKYTTKDGTLKLVIDEESVDYYTGEKDRVDGGFMVSSIQTYEKNGLHMKATNTPVEPFEGYATQYGYFELRCKMPACGGGGVAAWWMVGTQYDAKDNGLDSTQNGEIDIFETFFENANEFTPKVHTWNDPDLEEWSQKVQLEGDYVNEWHIYGMDWTPEYLVFYVDGQEVARTNQSPQYDMCMFLSLYTSGYPDYWGGGAANEVYPKEWEIDYIRVYKDENGYPNAVTKPAQRQPSGLDLIESELYTGSGDPAVGLEINDLARKGQLTSTVEHDTSLGYINSAGFNTTIGCRSLDKPVLPAEYTFTWDTPQNVDKVNLYANYANGQAPTEIDLQIQKEDDGWIEVAGYEIEWQSYTNAIEYAKMTVPNGKGITGLKVVINNANLAWEHYVIQKIHIYEENLYSLSTYRSTVPYTHPTREGYVFAGWYTDVEYKTPLGADVTTGNAYAKFVDREVLGFRYQLPLTTDKNSDSTAIRLVTSVDSKEYQTIGFKLEYVSGGRKYTKEYTTGKVYKTIKGTGAEGKEITYLPTEFSTASKYMMAMKLNGVPKEVYEITITVTPQWTTLDGTIVSGITRDIILFPTT